MNLQALKTFRRRDNGQVVSVGEKFIAQDHYGKAAVRAGLAVDLSGEVKPEPEKRRIIELDRKAKRAAPENRAVETAPENKAVPSSAGGEEQPPSLSPPARRSRKTTATPSATGARGRKKAGES